MTYTGVKMPTAAEAAPAKPATRALEFGARHRTLRRRARADHGRWKFLHRIQAAELRPQVQRAGRVPLVVRGRNVAMPGRWRGQPDDRFLDLGGAAARAKRPRLSLLQRARTGQ